LGTRLALRPWRTCEAALAGLALEPWLAFLAPWPQGTLQATLAGLAVHPGLALFALGAWIAFRTLRAAEAGSSRNARFALHAGLTFRALEAARAARTGRAGLALRAGRASLALETRGTMRTALALWAARPLLALQTASHLQRQQDVGGGLEPLDLPHAELASPGGEGKLLAPRLSRAGLGLLAFLLLDDFGHGANSRGGLRVEERVSVGVRRKRLNEGYYWFAGAAFAQHSRGRDRAPAGGLHEGGMGARSCALDRVRRSCYSKTAI